MNWSRSVNKMAAGGSKSSSTKNNNKPTKEKRTIFANNNSSLTILGIPKLPKDGPKYQKALTWNSPSTRAPRTSIEWEKRFSTKKKMSPQSDTFRKLFGHQFWFICTILFLIFNFTFFHRDSFITLPLAICLLIQFNFKLLFNDQVFSWLF